MENDLNIQYSIFHKTATALKDIKTPKFILHKINSDREAVILKSKIHNDVLVIGIISFQKIVYQRCIQKFILSSFYGLEF